MECAICFLSFTISGPQEPKVLECGHTFCSNCVGFFNNQCATCRRNFRITSTNFLLVELLNGKVDSKSSNNEQLLERSSSQIEHEIEERKRELELRRRQEIQNQLLNIKTSIELVQEEKSSIDNEINELRGKLRNLERTSKEREAQIDRLNNETLSLEKQLRGNLAGGRSSSNPPPSMFVSNTGRIALDRKSITKTCPICSVRTSARDDCINHIQKKHPEYDISPF